MSAQASQDPEQVRVRLEKRRQLVDAARQGGLDPYPHEFRVTHTVEAIRRDFDALASEGAQVRTASRVRAFRIHGELCFMDLAAGRDDPHVQVVLDLSKLPPEQRAHLDLVDLGDWAGVAGTCARTRRGEPSVMATEFRIVCKSVRPLPNFKGTTVQDEELLARQPELEMMFGRKRQVLRQRAAAVRAVRELLVARGATEVDTPFLNPYFGGADARPFSTHVWALDEDVFLAVSPEIEDKRLVVGGFTEGVFTFARNFRNEGIDRTHNPEFSSLEVYLPFHDVHDMMDLTEAIYVAACTALHGAPRCTWQGRELDFTPPWPRVEMLKAVREATGLDVGTMTAAQLADACRARGLDQACNPATTGAGKLAARVDAAGLRTAKPAASMSGAELRTLVQEHKLHVPMDLAVEWDFLVTGLFERFVEPTLVRPCHVILHPYRTTVLCKKAREGGDLPNGERLVERCESYAAGMEITNAYSELNDPVQQRELVAGQASAREGGDENAMPMNDLFLEAIEFGLPPTGGLGVGIDRMAMLLTDSAVIREVIAFPLVKRR
jgi:lysyl-tRNA synthetase, class II